MRWLAGKYGLFVIMLLALFSYEIIETQFISRNIRPDFESMKKARDLAAGWFEKIGLFKKEQKIIPDNPSQIAFKEMVGDDFSWITSTLGSLEAKELSANPDFAALLVRLLREAGIDSTQKVGVILTGSFPALAICTFAALQSLNIPAVIFSSVSASCYGANQPRATWIDMENDLRVNGGLKLKTTIWSMGSENDNGSGLTEEGRQLIWDAAKRNGVELYYPADLMESINYKMKILQNEQIKLLINIGGNQAAMGRCAHSIAIPIGLNKSIQSCNDPERGIIFRSARQGIPIIHLLQIKNLVSRYEMEPPTTTAASESSIYFINKNNRLALITGLGFLILILVIYQINKQSINVKSS